MTQRIWIVAIVVLIVAGAATALLIRSYRHAPLQQASARTCIGCMTVFWNGVARVRAERLSGTYVFTEEASYLVSFDDGGVTMAGRRLTSGCHEGVASEGTRLAFDAARGVRLRVPAPVEGCSEAVENAG